MNCPFTLHLPDGLDIDVVLGGLGVVEVGTLDPELDEVVPRVGLMVEGVEVKDGGAEEDDSLFC